MTDLFEKLRSLAPDNEAGATGKTEPGADRQAGPVGGATIPTSACGRQTIDLGPLLVSDLDDLGTAVAAKKEDLLAAILTAKAETDRQLSIARLERDQAYETSTANKVAPLLLASDKLRRQANLGYGSQTEAARWLKNAKAALRRRLKRQGRSDEYYRKVRELEASPEYRGRDPYGAYIREARREYCHTCKRPVLPNDWDVAHQLRTEIRDYSAPMPQLAILGYNETKIEADDYWERLAADDDDGIVAAK